MTKREHGYDRATIIIVGLLLGLAILFSLCESMVRASLVALVACGVGSSLRVPRRLVLCAPATVPFSPAIARAAELPTGGKALYELVRQAQQQLDDVPKLIDQGKWDSVRAILIKPPISDIWGKNAKPLLKKYAEAVGNADGDELAVLEAREEAQAHLQYLDMAVYNNVFSPAAGDAKATATPALIKQYYEMPMQEFRASKAALDALVELGGGLKFE